MDRLEQYLDQVCRGIAGPRSLRQHIRRELREHLVDAAAEHQSAGLSAEDALLRALADFGAPEQVRTELEATHGHRLMAVVVDKAMQWKEKTMRAKWLWSTWAYLAVLGIIAVNVLFLCFAQVICIPKLKKIESDGLIDFGEIQREPVMRWLANWVRGLGWLAEHVTWMVLVATGLWLIFEWRVRSENKTLMRLSALGSVGLVLSIVSLFIAGAISLPFFVGLPALGKLAAPFALEQISSLDTAMAELEKARAANDWESMPEQIARMQSALAQLEVAVSAIPSLTQPAERISVADARARIQSSMENLELLRQAVREKDSARFTQVQTKLKLLLHPISDAHRLKKQGTSDGKSNG